jgi:hypothetical protein
MVKVISLLHSAPSNLLGTEFNLEDEDNLERLAWESGYYLQEPKKITASSLIHGFFRMMSQGKHSLRNWALEIGLKVGCTVCKSSVEERLHHRTLSLATELLKQVLGCKMKEFRQHSSVKEPASTLLGRFNNVFLADSTCEKLPSNLALEFPSSYSHGEPTATLRLQTVYNFTRERFEQFHIGNFRQNDQGATDLILEVARGGDLILRDLGYFALENFQKMMKSGIFFISKLAVTTNLYDPQSGEQIHLLAFLKGKNRVDTIVHLGKKAKLPLRLIAQKLPQQVVHQKREKARKDRNKKANHDENYFELLEWVIFVTNVPPEKLSTSEIMEVYRLRWFIEIIFKAWKSHFNFRKILNKERMNLIRTQITIYLVLTQVAYWSLNVYQYIQNAVENITQRPLSLLKYFDLLNVMADRIFMIKNIEELDPLIPQFAKHATYEARKKRQNIKDHFKC